MEHPRSPKGTLIYPPPCQSETGKVEAMISKKARLVLPVLLLAASVLAVYPTTALEKQVSGTMTIDADGQAKPFLINQNGAAKKTTEGISATLTLSGSVRTYGNGQLELEGLSGTLVIDTTSYTVVSGKGQVNQRGRAHISIKTDDGNEKLGLILYGKIQGSDVEFDGLFRSRESKLFSLYFLSLSGEATLTTDTTTDAGDAVTTVIVTQDRTVTETVTQTQDNTVTTTETITQTESGTSSTVTVTETITTTVTATTSAAT